MKRAVGTHHVMVPPPGFKFVPKQQHVCGQSGCFECYDIWCERCESKDRRIIELEMRYGLFAPLGMFRSSFVFNGVGVHDVLVWE